MGEFSDGSKRSISGRTASPIAALTPNWETLDPRQGLSTWEALYYFVDREKTLLAYKLVERDPEVEVTNKPTEWLRFSMRSYWLADGSFVTELVKKLLSGELRARGFASNAALDAPRQEIHKDRWAELVLDVRSSRAQGQGIIVSQILVFAGEPTSSPNSYGRKQYSLAQLRSWYIKRLDELDAAGQRSSREQDYAAAATAFASAVPKRAVESLRRELAPANWRRGGRPAKPGSGCS